MKPPAAAGTIEAPVFDNLQLIIQRRAELAKSKAKYALTETDAKLLSTHSVEVHFTDGQSIIEEQQDITSVYRIKSGKVVVSRGGFQFNVIGRGWFIGDAMLIYDTPAYMMKIGMKAEGPVVLEQLNLPFVLNLFKIDSKSLHNTLILVFFELCKVLKAKVMRHLVAKYSYLMEKIIEDINHPLRRGMPTDGSSHPVEESITEALLTSAIASGNLRKEDSESSLSSTPSSSSLSSESSASSLSSGASTPSSPSPSLGPKYSDLDAHTTKPVTKREARHRIHAAYKSYPLANRGGGIQTMQVKSKKLKVVSKSFGFSFKTTIEFSKIQNITKVGENAATIVYQPRKVANVFFKNYYDREEFFGLVNSLITITPVPNSPEPARHGQSLTVPHTTKLDYDEVPLCGGKENMCKTIQTPLLLKKGDIVVEEGDLLQRVYTLLKGHCDIIQNGKKICTMEEGDIFGVGTLLRLRPIPVTLRVASETANIIFIPGYKLNALIDTDSSQAAEIYQHAAKALDRKISACCGYLPNYRRVLREQREEKERESTESMDSVSESGDDLETMEKGDEEREITPEPIAAAVTVV